MADVAFDHELKLGRAFQHVQDLERVIQSWRDGNNYTVRYEIDLDARWSEETVDTSVDAARNMLAGPVFIPGQGPGTLPDDVPWGQGVLTAYTSAQQPPTDPISLIIGDALHNMRSGLDTLAYALASAFTKPLPEEIASRSEFPIFGDEDRKGNAGAGSTLFQGGLPKIKGWDPSAQTVIEGLQPYQRGNAFRSDPLWILHELDRFSKHRLLHPTVASFHGTKWAISAFRNIRAIGPGVIDTYGGTIETETPISRIFGVHPIDPAADMHVEINPALDIAFSASAPAAAADPVLTTLGDIYTHIRDEVLPRLTSFL
jgi:hypothetical protein